MATGACTPQALFTDAIYTTAFCTAMQMRRLQKIPEDRMHASCYSAITLQTGMCVHGVRSSPCEALTQGTQLVLYAQWPEGTQGKFLLQRGCSLPEDAVRAATLTKTASAV
jgi:hypothetical protein